MALDIDGFAAFRAIGQASERFAPIAADVTKAARTLLTKQLKSKTMTSVELRAFLQVVGGETFGLILDGLKVSDLRSVLGKADRHYALLKSAEASALRQRLVALADGAEPSAKAVATKATKTAKPALKTPKAKVASILSPAFAVRWDGKEHDPPKRQSKK